MNAPHSAADWQRRLVGYFQSGDYATLEREAERALATLPGFVFGWKALAVARQALGKDALEAAAQAARLSPGDPEAQVNLGNILREAGRLDEALAALRQAVTLNPRQPAFRLNFANALRAAGQLAAAEAELRAAIGLAPGFAEAHNNLGHTLFGQPGRLPEAIACYRQALALQPDFRAAAENLLFALNYLDGVPPAAMRQTAEQVAARLAAAAPVLPPLPPRPAGFPLRVGLVSGDFRRHSVGNLLAPVLEALAGEPFEIHVFANQRVEDEVSQRIRAAVAAWHPVWGMSDGALAELVRAQSIDLLVDLAGYTAQNRLAVFAARPAPLQLAWLGYFATTGLGSIDYVLGSPDVTPASEADHFSEKCWRLPHTYYVFEPPALDLAPAAPRHGAPVLGCFSNLAKLSEPLLSTWCTLLAEVPEATLFLKAPQLASPEVRSALLARFARGGVGAERLRLEAGSSYRDYLEAYREVDLILDTTPFAGGLTSCEALWMGVPVLAWRGDRMIGHQGEMILRAAGLDDFIATDPADYVARAAAALRRRGEPADLALRAGLRSRLLASPLCDVAGFARELSSAWQAMWQRRAAS